MKYTVKTAVFGKLYHSLCRKGLRNAIAAQTAKEHNGRMIRTEYKEIWKRAAEVGEKNQLYSAYAMAAYFIAAVRVSCLPPETVYSALEDGCRDSRLFAKFMQPAEKYLAAKRLPGRLEWAKQTQDPAHQTACPNDWVVDIVTPQDAAGVPVFELGYDYYECGVCKLCRDEACPELAKYLCRLDYLMADMMGLALARNGTLAEGAEKCDFRYKRKGTI